MASPNISARTRTNISTSTTNISGSLESLTLPEASLTDIRPEHPSTPVICATEPLEGAQTPRRPSNEPGAHITFSPKLAAANSPYRTPSRSHSTVSLLHRGLELLMSGTRSREASPTPLAHGRLAGSRDPSPTRRPRYSRQSTFNLLRSKSNSQVHSPKLEAMMKQDAMPDLDSVNRALGELKLIPVHGDEDEAWIGNLTHLATTLSHASRDCKWLLNQAMQERSKGNTEICRAHCVEIVNNKYAAVVTKVYAYNILSTQASLGRAQDFLDQSAKLIKENEKAHPELDRLERVIEGLRISAGEREAAVKGNGSHYEAEHRNGHTEQNVSPKSSRILKWASRSSK